MKRFLSSFVVCMAVVSVMGDASAATGRTGVGAARMPSMAVAPVTKSVSKVKTVAEQPAKEEPSESEKPSEQEAPSVDMREKERAACMQNNIGIGNTFVWASRYSDINNYSTMIEDTENPGNNTCFVRVELKSNDSKVDLTGVQGKYFEMGRNITCGSWVNEDDIEKRILDGKKKGRTWATVGGAVGGAAIGVGSMELFGNKLIGGSVQGQKALEGNELLRSQLLVIKDKDPAQYAAVKSKLEDLKKKCTEPYLPGPAPEDCGKIDYEYLLSIM